MLFMKKLGKGEIIRHTHLERQEQYMKFSSFSLKTGSIVVTSSYNYPVIFLKVERAKTNARFLNFFIYFNFWEERVEGRFASCQRKRRKRRRDPKALSLT